MPFVWNNRLNTNIRVIDEQHRRIVDYINALEQANLTADRQMIAEAIAGVTDYTQSHFAFEESLLEEAGYRFIKPHKKVHELFIRRIDSYAERHNKGENVGGELYNLLSTWLINHIQHDDADYVASVKDKVEGALIRRQKEGNWFTRFLRGKG
ncbi:hypothetical protein AXE65_07310 [Ventosimonas gracilis]|uniref:Hemerythrin-like domain-containing protein n=1 Tax=Ventosimonas gracilis TaxID=1680762 RepID=A0A139SIU4_9GAMM|nr:bacteriohemerythrin [Ventosimonas gracilis]KXU34469.1 hypothetical protein AXE65_07310 [Ventosimonas gracilis]